MHKQLLVFTLCLFAGSAFSQNILFVDDNDNITDNSDSVRVALQQTAYGTFSYYNVADSAATPGSDMLGQFDAVIWYASTDGVGLGFWNAGTDGDSELISYLVNGGRVWVIGSDLLYAGGYNPGTVFTPGEFAIDFMGLQAYNVQSYGNDGNTGVGQVDLTAGAPAYFPDSLLWIFPTHWWVDGITSVAGATDLYTMGPASYPLAGQVAMTHFVSAETHVMSTFFDPALIDTRAHRSEFLERSVFYLLDGLAVGENAAEIPEVYPNPAKDQLVVRFVGNEPLVYELVTQTGKAVRSGTFSGTEAIVDLAGLDAGIYFLQTVRGARKIVKL